MRLKPDFIFILTQDKRYLTKELPSSLFQSLLWKGWTDFLDFLNDICTTCLVITFAAVRKFNPSSPEFEICGLARDNSVVWKHT